VGRKGGRYEENGRGVAVKSRSMLIRSALFKGGLARIIRSSPQFSVTLASYELLVRLFFF
jgi:hypothetical protein